MGWKGAIIAAIVAAVCVLTAAAPAGANPYRVPGVLDDGERSGGGLGHSVSISGDGSVAVVGEPASDGGAGAAVVYANTDGAWRFVERLRPSHEQGAGHFGAAVSMDFDGQTLAVGAPDDLGGIGSAWVFAQTDGGWTQQGELLAVPGTDVRFGASVAVASGGLEALVGAPLSDGGMGQAYTFTYDSRYGWERLQKMHRTGVTGAAHFGASVALTRNSSAALVGAPNAAGGDGAVYPYTHFGLESPYWIEFDPIGSPPPGAAFGASVAISSGGDHAVIGAPQADAGAGAVYQYRRSGVQEAIFRNPTGSTAGRFGASVALAGPEVDQLLVGAPGDNDGAGAAYDFDASGGADKTATGAALTSAAPAATGDAYGTSVAVAADGSHALVGAPGARSGDGAATHFMSANITVPDPPVAVSAVAGIDSADVSWAAPWSTGGSPIASYTATASPGGRTCRTSDAWGCTVVGLTPGRAYTITVTATNGVGTSAPSNPSEPVTPTAAPGEGPQPGGGGSAGDTGAGDRRQSVDTRSGAESQTGATAHAAARPATPSGPPTLIRRTKSSITLAWPASRGAAGYRIYELSAGRWKPVGRTTARRRFTRRGLRPRSRHRFAVRAADVHGTLSAPLLSGWLRTR